MRLIGTMMVRDEIDVVAAMIEHHLAQGLDLMIVTDNASVDGTTELVERYAALGVVELHHDPLHQKQQGRVVTAMARRARTQHRADWVLNLDADEFLVPVNKSMTLRDCLENTSLHLNAYTVPVTNLVGPAAWSGGGLHRLTWRDVRTDEQLQEIGIHAQPTPNAVHRGECDVVVSQGNHFVSLASNGQPPEEVSTEVLHLPWRSWAQLERKVINAGRAYESNPDLRPSPKHHGMRDYMRYLAGTLQDAYLARTPLLSELEEGEQAGHYRRDQWLGGHLLALVESALIPELLKAVADPASDHPVSESEHAAGTERGRKLLAAEDPVAVRR